ncbi:MAG TPA: arylesterase [Magnetospirillum sp.]|nr:arylesterase [Magnetospirillum sp.]
MAETLRILALGDSLTAGYGVAATDAFPVQLERALRADGYDVAVLNAGVSGDTTAGGKARLDWALADKPQIAIVELGANDGLRGLDPAITERNLDAIVSRLKADGVRVLLTGMRAPPNYGPDYASTFDQMFPRLAERHRVAFYPFFLEGVARDPRLNQPDGLHPTRDGVAEIVRRILPSVKAVLGPTPAGGKG